LINCSSINCSSINCSSIIRGDGRLDYSFLCQASLAVGNCDSLGALCVIYMIPQALKET
jgi:hypothetical protein